MTRSLCQVYESRPFGERLAACEAMVADGYLERVREPLAELAIPTQPDPAQLVGAGGFACLLLLGKGMDIAGRGPSWEAAYRSALERELYFLDNSASVLADTWEVRPPTDPGAYLRKYLAGLVPILIIGQQASAFADRCVT